jgi:hypothetical protein
MATLAQKMGSVKDIQAHLRHAKADTTANEYMQELPESVMQMVDSVYLELRSPPENGKARQAGLCYQIATKRKKRMAARGDLLPIATKRRKRSAVSD